MIILKLSRFAEKLLSRRIIAFCFLQMIEMVMSLRSPHQFVRTRRLSLEALENRRVMAGNVLVALSGHNLLITGDAADNAITVNAIPGIPGRLSIQPGGDLSTTINGKSNPIVLNFPSFQDTRFALERAMTRSISLAMRGQVIRCSARWWWMAAWATTPLLFRTMTWVRMFPSAMEPARILSR